MLLGILVIGLVLLVILMLPLFLAIKCSFSEKMTPYECGFPSFSKSCSQLSLQFVMVLLIFILFDLEVIVLMPFLMKSWATYFILISFMWISLMVEWKMGRTKWVV